MALYPYFENDVPETEETGTTFPPVTALEFFSRSPEQLRADNAQAQLAEIYPYLPSSSFPSDFDGSYATYGADLLNPTQTREYWDEIINKHNTQVDMANNFDDGHIASWLGDILSLYGDAIIPPAMQAASIPIRSMFLKWLPSRFLQIPADLSNRELMGIYQRAMTTPPYSDVVMPKNLRTARTTEPLNGPVSSASAGVAQAPTIPVVKPYPTRQPLSLPMFETTLPAEVKPHVFYELEQAARNVPAGSVPFPGGSFLRMVGR